MIRPSFQFYPGDWQSNSNLRRCTHEEKGIWMDVLCLMHDQAEYGVLRWPLKEIAQVVGCSVAKLKGLIAKGVLKGADAGQNCPELIYTPRSGRKDGPSVTLVAQQDSPIWYSSRMVIDEYKRNTRGGTSDASNHSPKPPFGDDMGDAPNPSSNPSPFHARPRASAPSSSSSSSKNQNHSVDTAAIPQPVPGEESASSPPPDRDPVKVRMLDLCQLLRQRGAAIQPGDPNLLTWAQTGVTDAQALNALELAQQRRVDAGSTQPITAAYLNALMADVATPPARASPRPSNRHDRNAAFAEQVIREARQHDQTEPDQPGGHNDCTIAGESRRIG